MKRVFSCRTHDAVIVIEGKCALGVVIIGVIGVDGVVILQKILFCFYIRPLKCSCLLVSEALNVSLKFLILPLKRRLFVFLKINKQRFIASFSLACLVFDCDLLDIVVNSANGRRVRRV